MTDDWITTTLGEVAEIRGGGTPSTKEPSCWGGDVVWLTPTEVVKSDGQWIDASERMLTRKGLEHSSAKWLPAGTVLLTTRASVGFAALARVPLTTNQGFQSLIPSDAVLAEFLLYWIQGNRVEFTSRAGGSTFPEISKKKVASIPIVVPPLAVQRRIVDLIAHLDTHLANLRAEHEVATQALDALRIDLFSETHEWSETSLADVSEVRLGRMLSKERATGEDLAPYIRNANVQWGGLDLSDLKEMSFPAKERETYSLIAGDILVCEGGDPGRSVILDADLPGVYYQKAVHRVRCRQSVSAEFLHQWLIACYKDGRLADLCTNTTIKHLTAEKFRTLTVRFPSLSEQDLIVRTLQSFDAVIRSLNCEIVSLSESRNALLGVLLSGDVVIPANYDSLWAEAA